MKEITGKLRKRFVIVSSLLLGVLLLIIFSLMFTSVVLKTMDRVEDALDAAMAEMPRGDRYDYSPEGNKCIRISLTESGQISTQHLIDVYDNADAMAIIEGAKATENGPFKVGALYFSVRMRTTSILTEYFVCDCTEERTSVITTGVILVVCYAISMVAIVFLCYVSSLRLLKPVVSAFEKQRELIANASHELKTPLTIITTDLSVIEDSPESTVADNAKWLDSIGAQTKRMNSLVLDMLDLSRLEQTDTRSTTVELSKLVESAVLSFEAICFEHGIALVTDIKEGIIVRASRENAERLVLILLDNAVKYNRAEKGEIKVLLSVVKDSAQLKVINTGEGMTKEETERVFDRFYKGDEARTQDGNSFGLGLSIAQAIVAGANGTITCDSVKGENTVFTVSLPLDNKKG